MHRQATVDLVNGLGGLKFVLILKSVLKLVYIGEIECKNACDSCKSLAFLGSLSIGTTNMTIRCRAAQGAKAGTVLASASGIYINDNAA